MFADGTNTDPRTWLCRHVKCYVFYCEFMYEMFNKNVVFVTRNKVNAGYE